MENEKKDQRKNDRWNILICKTRLPQICNTVYYIGYIYETVTQ
jgi:hypothetical protein